MGRLSAMKKSSEMESCVLCVWIPSRSTGAFQAAPICLLGFPSLEAEQAATALGIQSVIRGASEMAKQLI